MTAFEKLDKEYKEGKGKLNRYALAISNEGSEGFNILAALKQLCEDNDEFAQAVMQQDKSVCDCLSEIVKGAKQSLSDLLTLKRAVQFYFPGADVKLTMSLDLGDGGVSNKSDNKSKSVKFDLDGLLDF